MAGTLHAIPEVVEPGDTVRVTTENLGDVTLEFGLGARAERFVAGRWEETISGQVVPDVLMLARPGERVGPRYGNRLRDYLELPDDLEPGLYRILKNVRASQEEEDHEGQLTLDAIFEVRPAD